MCPFCKSKDKKFKIRKNGYDLYTCKNCSLCFLDPMPTGKEIASVYGKNYYQNDKELVHGYSNYSQMRKVLTVEATGRIKYIKNFTREGKLLDIGCGLGFFLEAAQKAGFKVSGNDISPYAKEIVSKNKISFYSGPVKTAKLPQNYFDIVTAWDVFEHIPEVNPAFETVHRSLKKGGYLILTTPSLECWDAKLMGRFWYGYQKIPEHLIFFSPASIKKVLSTNGFKTVKIQTWGFERSLNFLVVKATIYIPKIDKLLLPILKFFKIEEKSLYFPLTDMIVVAQKTK